MTATDTTSHGAGTSGGAAASSSVAVSDVTAVRVLASEWIKMRSLRSTGLTLLVAMGSMIAIACLIGWATNNRWPAMSPAEMARFDPISRSLSGVNLAELAIGVLGVLLISGEYATGMIRATLSAVPARLPVLWAKAVLYAVITFVLMLVATLIAFVTGQFFLASHGTTLAATGAVSSIVGVAGYLTLVGLLALALGFIIRSTAGGIATYVGLLLVVPRIGELLPTSWQTAILPYLPSNAGASMYTLHPDPGSLSAGAGLLVLAIWVVVAFAAAAVMLTRRDA